MNSELINKELGKMKKRTVVFFCDNAFERHAAENLAASFEAAGWKIGFSKSLFRKATVGVYYGDNHVPGFQNLTVRSINGLDQDHTYPQDVSAFFLQSNWGAFDYGILPTRRWINRFGQGKLVSQYTPKYGVSLVGWPKLDGLISQSKKTSSSDPTVLYAPQMENGTKQAEVSNACLEANVRLIVKHWESNETLSGAVNRGYLRVIDEANAYTRKVLGSKVVISDPRENIVNSLLVSDILIADQTSVIYEAAAMGIPTISVAGWKHWCGDCPGSELASAITYVAQKDGLAQIISLISSQLALFESETRRRFQEEFSERVDASLLARNMIEAVLLKTRSRGLLFASIRRLPSVVEFEIRRVSLEIYDKLLFPLLPRRLVRAVKKILWLRDSNYFLKSRSLKTKNQRDL